MALHLHDYDYSPGHPVGSTVRLNAQRDEYSPTDDVQWTIDWGDGHTDSFLYYYFTLSSHVYTAPGAYLATVTVIEYGSPVTGAITFTIVPLNPQSHPSGALQLPGAEGTLHLSESAFSGVPFSGNVDITFSGPVLVDQYGDTFNPDNFAVRAGGALVLWYSYTATQSGTLVLEATTEPGDNWEPIGIACTDELYIINEMTPLDYYPKTRAHMGVRVERGQNYIFGVGLDDATAGLYLDVSWNFQRRTISGPCMFILGSAAEGVLVYAVSLGDDPVVEPAMWMYDPSIYWGRPAATNNGRLYVSRGRSGYPFYAARTGLMKSTNESLRVPPISVYDNGIGPQVEDLSMLWSEERQMLLAASRGNNTNLKMADQKFQVTSEGWVVEDGMYELRQGDSIDITAPADAPTRTVRVIAMVRHKIYNIGDLITIPIPTYSGQAAVPAFSDYVTIAAGETQTVSFPSVTYAYGDFLAVDHYMIINNNHVQALAAAVQPDEGPDGVLIYAFDENGTHDYWFAQPHTDPPQPFPEGNYTITQNFVDDWVGQKLIGDNFWTAELLTTTPVSIFGGSYSAGTGTPRRERVVRYRLDANHVATETLRWEPTLYDPSLLFGGPLLDNDGMKYFTVNQAETRLLVTYVKENPVDDHVSNPNNFNNWYTGGMWIQVYDLTTPEPTFMREFRFVPWPSLAGTYTSEPGFNTYEFYAYGTIEFDPTDDNYAFMINNSDRPNGPLSWAMEHQTYVFRIPLYEDYTVQYAAMRTPWCTFDNPDNQENWWFTFGSMGPKPFGYTQGGAHTVKFAPNA